MFGQKIGIRTVVHVMYMDAKSNLTDAQVLKIIDSVNKGFSKTLPAKFKRPTSIFDSLWADTEIKLCLADRDPAGAITNGITHTKITDSLISFQTPDAYISWNTDKYLNIYLGPAYHEPGYSFFVMGGWADIPGIWGETSYAATVASNISPNTISAALTHEVGHLCGLEHTSSAGIGDVPKGIYAPLITVPGEGYPSFCSPSIQAMNSIVDDDPFWTSKVPAVDPPDMVENFMNLTLCCAYMFTKGQKNVMRGYINANHKDWITTTCSDLSNISTVNTNEETLFVYPNPSNNYISIQNISPDTRYQIKDVIGKILLSGVINSAQDKIDLSGFAPGTYFMVIHNKGIAPLKFQVN